MVRARRISPVALLLVAASIAGCGSSSSSSGSSAAATPTSSTGTSASSTPTGGTSTPTTTGGTSASPTPTGGASATPTGGASAVAACKHGVQLLTHLSQGTRERLEATCEKAAGGDANTRRKAAEEACRELVNASPLPAGAAKDRALSACSKAGGAAGSSGK